MKDITNNLKKPDVWKIQLTIPTSIYQIGLETSVMGSGFIFDRFNLLHYICHKNKSKTWRIIYRFSQYDKTPKSQKNDINDDDNCFQYDATVTLNHDKIGKKLERISKTKPFINKYS